MNKKGFTLIELLAVVVVLGIIAVISVPKIIETVNKSKDKLYKEQENKLVELAEEYIQDNDIEESFDSFVVTKEQLIDGGYISDVYDLKDKTSVCGAYVYISQYTTSPRFKAYISCNQYVTEDYEIYNSLTQYTMTNLLENGSFEEGIGLWSFDTNVSISSKNTKYDLFSARNYNSAQYKGVREMITPPVNHIYYMSVWMYTANKGNGYCYSQINLYYSSTNHYFTSSQSNTNIWEKKGILVSYPDVTSSYMRVYTILTTASDTLQDCYGDGMVLVDLTDVFGSGNEPTKEWCDNNIDYFDGTKTFYLPLIN